MKRVEIYLQKKQKKREIPFLFYSQVGPSILRPAGAATYLRHIHLEPIYNNI